MVSPQPNTTAFVAGPHNASPDWLQPTENEKQGNKKKSMERISKLFQKKTKKQTPSIAPSVSSVSLSLTDTVRSDTGPSEVVTAAKHESQVPSICEPMTRFPVVSDNESNPADHDISEPVNVGIISPPHGQSSEHGPNDGHLAIDSQLQRLSLSRNASVRSRKSLAESAPCATEASLSAKLVQQMQLLESLQRQSQQIQRDNQALEEHVTNLVAKKEQRKESVKQLRINYDAHMKAMRATNDTLDSVVLKIRHLKHIITTFATELVEKGDPVIATSALCNFWRNLHEPIAQMGNPLPKEKQQILTEKYMMDVLINQLNLNTFPGFELIEQYNRVQNWLEEQEVEPAFITRLRQEVALIIAREEGKNGAVTQSRREALQECWKQLYTGIVTAYPFVYAYDKDEPDISKHYGAKVRALVDMTISLGLAIKGLEYDIVAAPVREGEHMFDPFLMTDEDQQTSGIVRFCICPPFVVTDATPPQILEKGRVLCSPPRPPLPDQPS